MNNELIENVAARLAHAMKYEKRLSDAIDYVLEDLQCSVVCDAFAKKYKRDILSYIATHPELNFHDLDKDMHPIMWMRMAAKHYYRAIVAEAAEAMI